MLTVVVSLAVYQTHQSIYGALDIEPAMVSPAFMVQGDERRG